MPQAWESGSRLSTTSLKDVKRPRAFEEALYPSLGASVIEDKNATSATTNGESSLSLTIIGNLLLSRGMCCGCPMPDDMEHCLAARLIIPAKELIGAAN
jgi:hypothetical protein